MRILNRIAYILMVIGAINWGLIGLFRLDIVALLFGANSMLSRIVYTLVGISAVVYTASDMMETQVVS